MVLEEEDDFQILARVYKEVMKQNNVKTGNRGTINGKNLLG